MPLLHFGTTAKRPTSSTSLVVVLVVLVVVLATVLVAVLVVVLVVGLVIVPVVVVVHSLRRGRSRVNSLCYRHIIT